MEAQIEQQLEKILPEDIARTFESAYHVFQGDHDKMEDLIKHGGSLLKKIAQRLNPTQVIIGIAVIAAVAVVVVNRSMELPEEGEASDASDDKKANAKKLSSAGQNKGQQEDKHDNK
ncbi:hypothetical protein [Hymenobacter sp. BT491]|uniref:hypothetical protein n=1 Tax=Hymenobacter sp. BT491 TaxID=2766779 RepID=UPI00165362D5|nr:hypothetical protein [Hymenobacter sp. BT491]MBC6991565.1 hypothetical protein [Hymenobacter sp. BT491]